ncbi:MAG: ABC transporter ATP-binding protein [Gemmatimonadaceae bacterium]|nr:ABC transporter ATP-binding protein [Gemmatimonadaceae bacterium]
MIGFRNVSAVYAKGGRRAVDGVTFDAFPGEVTAVVGPNGSGKSTLVRAMLGRIELSQGKITINENDIRSMSAHDIATAVAILPQREDPVFPLTVEEYVGLGRYPRLGLWRNASSRDAEAVEGAMQRAEVESFAARKTDQLSGGEWQRVRIARALAQESRAIVLDEPTTYLDISHEMALFELLGSLATEGLAVLVVSHELNLVSRFASRIVLLREGKLAASGTAEDVMKPEILERVFDWPLHVMRDAVIGAPALFPLRRPAGIHQQTQTL